MRSRMTVVALLAVTLVVGLFFFRSVYLDRDLPRQKFEVKTLHVLTYTTFVGATGPGPDILDRFKKDNGIDVDVVTAGDAGLLLQRLKLMEATHPFDVVIGLNQLMLAQAQAEFKWRKFGTTKSRFVAFDWSPMTFIYRESDVQPPHKFADLLNRRYKDSFALQDPHTSAPGLQFSNWVKGVEGGRTKDFLRRFQANVQSISPSWALSYGLFKRQRAAFVFSYLTSLAFHWSMEHDRRYQAVELEEGHPIDTEYVAIPDNCQNCELAAKFVRTMLKPSNQRLIMLKNFMLPVDADVEKGTVFEELPHLKTINPGTDSGLREWDEVFSH